MPHIVIFNFLRARSSDIVNVLQTHMNSTIQKSTRITSTSTMSTRITCLLEDGTG